MIRLEREMQRHPIAVLPTILGGAFRACLVAALVLALGSPAAFAGGERSAWEDLRSDDDAIRAVAAERLAQAGPLDLDAFLGELSTGLDDPVADVRFYTLVTLQIAATADEADARRLADAAPALVERLVDPDARVRAAAATALALIAPHPPARTAGALVARLDDPEASVRAAAAEALGSLASAGRIPFDALLDALLDDPEGSVRTVAARSVGRVAAGRREGVDALTVALDDESPFVRAEAARALGALGPAARSAAPALRGLAETPGESEVVRRNAESALRLVLERPGSDGARERPKPGRPEGR
jgi:HEAT repeat protein